MSIPTEQPERPLPSYQELARNSTPGEGQIAQKPRMRNSSAWAKVLILLILIFMVVFLGGDIRQMLAGSTTPALKVLAKTGPLIQTPLNSDEINQLHHLSEYLNDKTLARMYLSHMTLDQKLGQLFMVQYWGYSYSSDLETLGINTDLATDVDVPVLQGPDQYMRTWGYTPQEVIDWGGTYLRAIQGDGEIACLKHFPGLGAATTDAHQNLPVVKRSRDQLYSTELAPYKYFVQSQNKLDNPGMIMTTDVMMPALDPTMPAELSHTIVTDILRHELGYDSVVLTD